MRSQTLLVLAAGIGSRFGGPKQMAAVGPHGEFIIDYSIFDAIRSGFDRIAFVIRKDIEADFRATIGGRVEKQIDTTYVFQELDSLPEGYQLPPERQKPWGTAHAILSAADAIDGAFGVINADDFYGPKSYAILSDFLRETSDEPNRYAMVGFALGNTLSEKGYVSRGLCAVSPSEELERIEELTRIEKIEGRILAGDRELQADDVASMNLWGFKRAFFDQLALGFRSFLDVSRHDPKSEFFITSVMDDLIRSGQVRVQVLKTPERWAGVTYREEIELVRNAISAHVAAGRYPAPLWD